MPIDGRPPYSGMSDSHIGSGLRVMRLKKVGVSYAVLEDGGRACDCTRVGGSRMIRGGDEGDTSVGGEGTR